MTQDQHNGGWIVLAFGIAALSGAIVGCAVGWLLRGLL
jgi:NhaP-type Na+/H+ or K+/H+ antiporter